MRRGAAGEPAGAQPPRKKQRFGFGGVISAAKSAISDMAPAAFDLAKKALGKSDEPDTCSFADEPLGKTFARWCNCSEGDVEASIDTLKASCGSMKNAKSTASSSRR